MWCLLLGLQITFNKINNRWGTNNKNSTILLIKSILTIINSKITKPQTLIRVLNCHLLLTIINSKFSLPSTKTQWNLQIMETIKSKIMSKLSLGITKDSNSSSKWAMATKRIKLAFRFLIKVKSIMTQIQIKIKITMKVMIMWMMSKKKVTSSTPNIHNLVITTISSRTNSQRGLQIMVTLKWTKIRMMTFKDNFLGKNEYIKYSFLKYI